MTRFVLFGMFLSLAGIAYAEPRPVTLPNTHQYTLHSEKIGQTFEINVWHDPLSGDEPSPVIYVTDGLYMFTMMQASIRMMQLTQELPSLTLVGIGYAADMPIQKVLATRGRELTPTYDAEQHQEDLKTGYVTEEDPKSGGADAFLEFIEAEVKPLVRENYNVSTNETLVGHSLGGLFTLYTLLTQPDLYDRYLASSPSLWWHDKYMYGLEKELRAENSALSARVFLAVGEHEVGDTIDMVTDMHDMAALLSQYESLNIASNEFRDETHQSVIPGAYSRGLRALFQDR